MRHAALACALALAACVGPSDHQSSVHDLRVLAMRTEPPDYVLPPGWDYQSGTAPPLSRFHLRALLGDTPGLSRELTFRFTFCPKPDNGRCEQTDNSTDGMLVLGEGTVTSHDGLAEVDAWLGTDDQVLDLPPLIQKAIEDDPYQGFGGLPLFIGLHVTSGADEVWGEKRLPIWLPIPGPIPGIKPNLAPPEPDVLFDGVLTLPGDKPAFVADEGVDVFPPDPELKEQYVVPTFTGGTKTLQESWTYGYYTTKGYFSPDKTGGYDAVLQRDNDTPTRFQVSSLEPAGDFKVVVLVRDGRGGETWTIRDATWPGPK
jgi:hypothetical protein